MTYAVTRRSARRGVARSSPNTGSRGVSHRKGEVRLPVVRTVTVKPALWGRGWHGDMTRGPVMGEQQTSISCEGLTVGSVEQVLAAALEAYICFDADGDVVAWNPAAEQMFGRRRQDVCGKALEGLIVAPGARTAFRACLAQVATDPGRPKGQRLELTGLHADGHSFPITLALTATDTDDGRRFHLFVNDVSAARRAQRFAEAQAAVSRGLADADSSARAIEQVVQALGVVMGWPVVEMWLVDEPRQVLQCAARHTGRDVAEFCPPQMEYGIGLPGMVHATGQPHWIADLAEDTGSSRSRVAARNGLHVAVGVPIRSGNLVLGALCVYGDHVEDPEDGLTTLLAGIAAHTGQYLERRRAEEVAVELARTKDEFLALVTHELRNPLAIITSTAAVFGEELDDGFDEQSCRRHLHTITRSAQRLTVMANDLLDLARLESGDLAIDPEAAGLTEIIEQAIRPITPTAAEKQITMTTYAAGPLFLHADPHRLRQVADNLLGNAIKYTPAGGTVTIAARLQGADSDAARIVWTISDTGIGIPAAERHRLFRRFYRASTAVEHRIPGTGLGLVVCRTIVERHHGSITVSDHDGPGTTFTITLPVKPPA